MSLPPTKPPRLRIAVVGLNFGGWIARGELRQPPANQLLELVAVADLERPKAEKLAAELGVRACGTLAEVLAAPDVDVVGLFTGPAGRAELLRQIIRAGKDVMTTKPFEVDAAAAEAVLREAQALGRVIHLNSPSPLPAADLRQILAWHDRYDLGRPVACRIETWTAYDEQADGSWYDDPARCPVAPIFRLGIYLINDVLRLLGEPEAVTVFSSRVRTGRPTADNAQVGIRFRNGALANIFASFCIGDRQDYRNTLTLNFERGTVYRNPPPSPTGGPVELLLVRGTGERAPVVERVQVTGHSGLYDWEAFHRAVRGETLAGAVTPEQVALGIRVIQAMARAEQSGRAETVAGVNP